MFVQTMGYSYHQHHQDPRYKVAITGDEIQHLDNVLTAAPMFANDTETDGVRWWDKDRVCGISFTAPTDQGLQSFYLPMRHRTGQVQANLDHAIAVTKKHVENPEKVKLYHNRKFDDHMLRREGIHMQGQVIDTMCAARLYNENESAKLKHRGVVDLGDPNAEVFSDMLELDLTRLATEAGMGKKAYLAEVGYSTLDIWLAGKYAGYDTELTYRLYEHYCAIGIPQRFSVSPRGPDFWGIWQTEMELARVLTDMEEVGIPVDVEHVHKMAKHLKEHAEYAEFQFYQDSGGAHFELGSDDKVRQYLLDIKCKLTETTKNGNLSVDERVIKSFMGKHPHLKWLLRYKHVTKLLSTYTQTILDSTDEFGVCHCDLQQMGTKTGRLSCMKPNLQNQPSFGKGDIEFLEAILGFPKETVELCAFLENVKNVFLVQRNPMDPFAIACGNRQMVRVFTDYSQVELRVLAHYTQDPTLLKTYRENGDVHDATEEKVFGTIGEKRRLAKVINFGLSYCMSPIGFVRQVEGVTPDEAQMYFDQYNEGFPRVPAFRNEFWAFVRTKGQCSFSNMFGRSRYVPDIVSENRRFAEAAKRQAIATLIQGTAAEFTKLSIVLLDLALRDRGLATRITMTVHDEIQTDGPMEELAEVAHLKKAIMEDFPDMTVPIIVDLEWSGTRWADKAGIPGM